MGGCVRVSISSRRAARQGLAGSSKPLEPLKRNWEDLHEGKCTLKMHVTCSNKGSGAFMLMSYSDLSLLQTFLNKFYMPRLGLTRHQDMSFSICGRVLEQISIGEVTQIIQEKHPPRPVTPKAGCNASAMSGQNVSNSADLLSQSHVIISLHLQTYPRSSSTYPSSAPASPSHLLLPSPSATSRRSP